MKFLSIYIYIFISFQNKALCSFLYCTFRETNSWCFLHKKWIKHVFTIFARKQHKNYSKSSEAVSFWKISQTILWRILIVNFSHHMKLRAREIQDHPLGKLKLDWCVLLQFFFTWWYCPISKHEHFRAILSLELESNIFNRTQLEHSGKSNPFQITFPNNVYWVLLSKLRLWYYNRPFWL